MYALKIQRGLAYLWLSGNVKNDQPFLMILFRSGVPFQYDKILLQYLKT